MENGYDKIIIGAGFYGFYAADFCSKKGEKILVLEYERVPFSRATYVNQARVHMGYHYPRSLTTALKSAGYFRRFTEDFGFCIHDKFDQVYATSRQFSWTDAKQFMDFCHTAGIRCDEIAPSRFFHSGVCDGAFLTEEYTYDAGILRSWYQDRLEARKNVRILYGVRIEKIVSAGDIFEVQLGDGDVYKAPYILNATYASVNQILRRIEGVKSEPFPVKYELCEIILCTVSDSLKELGITVMDGPFFSIMPFGRTGIHSLTSVTFTPHMTCYDELPRFACQSGLSEENFSCSLQELGNCSNCPHRPGSAWPYMFRLARKYLKEEYGFTYKGSLFSMKPILKSSEVDDSRPTTIKVLCEKPTLVSVLSGKINTIYDLESFL